MFYAAGTYGFYGYVFADLTKEYEYVFKWVSINSRTPPYAKLIDCSPPSSSTNPSPALSKKTLSYGSFAELLDGSEWYRPAKSDTTGRSPFRDLTRNQTKERDPLTVIAILGTSLSDAAEIGVLTRIALWEYEKRYGSLPSEGNKKRRRPSLDQGDRRTAPNAPAGSDETAEESKQDALPKWGEVTEDESKYRRIYTELQSQLGLHPKFRGTDRQLLGREEEMIS